jgi:Glyoxalase-like domain
VRGKMNAADDWSTERSTSMVVRFQVSFDAADPQRLAAFWQEALGYQQQEPPEGYTTWEDWARAMGIPEETWNDVSALVDPEGVMPRLFFQRVPEPKTAKNRVHLDVSVSGGPQVSRQDRRPRVDAAVERLTGLGATLVRANDELDQYWVVMQDPEGNEFCLQ